MPILGLRSEFMSLRETRDPYLHEQDPHDQFVNKLVALLCYYTPTIDIQTLRPTGVSEI
jgi:hypothetical protein